MRVLHLDYGILEHSELTALDTEIKNLIKSCDNFTHFELKHFTENGKHGIFIRMELMENNRPQANDLPAEPAKSIITFSVFRNATQNNGLEMLYYSLISFIQSKPFHDEIAHPSLNP